MTDLSSVPTPNRSDGMRRRMHEEAFDMATRDLDRPILRPVYGARLHPDTPPPADTDAPPTQRCGEPVPPMQFTDDELEWF